MIALLRGVLIEKSAGRILVDVEGVGYEVFIPFSTYYELAEPGERVTLRIYTHVKENELSLYGFSTQQEKNLFNLIIQISGIGPKLGVTILSGLPAKELVEAVVVGDLVRLNSIPGVGKKTAERIILELKGKLDGFFPESSSKDGEKFTSATTDDVLSALVNLGYNKVAARKAINTIRRDEDNDGFQTLLKRALSHLSGS